MKTEVKSISPALAKELLQKNTRNRKLTKALVKEYAGYMNRGEWKLTHQGICVSETDIILDGQHRLEAVVLSGKTVPMLLTTGISDSTMLVIDTGKKRTPGDSLHLLGIGNANVVSASISSYLKFKHGFSTRTLDKRDMHDNVLSYSERYRILLENEELIQLCLNLAGRCNKKAKFYSISAIAGLSMCLCIDKKYSISVVEDFFEQVHLFSKRNQVPATKTLSNVLIKYATGSEKLKPEYKHAITIKAWNAFVTSSDVKVLKYSTTEQMPALI